MELPKQVEEAANLAEQLHAQMMNPVEPETTDEPVVADIPEQPEPSDVPHDDDIEELRKFKERYLSLKGKYDAEVPRLHQDLKELKQSVFERLTPKEPEPPQPVNERLAKFTEEYGEDFVETIKELLRSEVDPIIKQNVEPVQSKIASVEDNQVQVARDNFVSYLDTKVKGNWQELWQGSDPKFAEFLAKPDPSGLYTYAELVQAYNDNWDADRLSAVFNTYLATKQPVEPKPEPPNPTKDAIIAPSRSTTHATPNVDDKRIWTAETMREFEKADRAGKYDHETSKAMWDDLLAAPAENRIRF